ncbi:MAG: poly-gamma-glutamate system protein, partial [Myxococcota bacterium]
HLPAKRTSINPNYAAVVVEWLQRLDAKPGDAVAVGVTGSFPALNIAVYSAIQALDLEPIIVVSGSGSDYGATVPGLSWIDMERELNDADVLRSRSVAATLGGDQDRARLQPPEARALLTEAMTKSGSVFLDPDSVEESVRRRLDTIDAACSGCRLVAYLNVGGGEASMGPKTDRNRFGHGITKTAPIGLSGPSVALSLLERGIPLVHVGNVIQLARQYEFPIEPLSEVPVGIGTVFLDHSPRRWFALAAILLIVCALLAITRLDFVQRIGAGNGRDDSDARTPQQMV